MDQVPGTSSHFTRHQQKKIKLAQKTKKQEKRIGQIFKNAHSGAPRTSGHQVDQNLLKIQIKHEFEVKKESVIDQEGRAVKTLERGEKEHKVLIKQEAENSETEEVTQVVTVKEEVDIPTEEVDYDSHDDTQMKIFEQNDMKFEDDEMNDMSMESQLVIKKVTGAKKKRKEKSQNSTASYSNMPTRKSSRLNGLQEEEEEQVIEEDERVLSLFKAVFEIFYKWIHPRKIDKLQGWEVDQVKKDREKKPKDGHEFYKMARNRRIPPELYAELMHQKRVKVHMDLTDLRQVCSTWCRAFDELVQENVIDCVAIVHFPYNLDKVEHLNKFLKHFGKDPRGPAESRCPFIGRSLHVGTIQKGLPYWNSLFSLLKLYGKHVWNLKFSCDCTISNRQVGFHDHFRPVYPTRFSGFLASRNKSSPDLTAHQLYLFFRQILKLVPNLKTLRVDYTSNGSLSDTFIEEHPLPKIASLEDITIDKLPWNVRSNLFLANNHVTRDESKKKWKTPNLITKRLFSC